MAPQNEIISAVPYAHEATEPLLKEEQERPVLEAGLFRNFKLSSLVLGLLVGFFIQFSTLGANFLVITIWGEEVVTKSKTDIVVFSLLWSFFTSAMAIVILGFLRTLVTIAYKAVRNHNEDLLEEMILHMECRFVVGALVGVCLAWTMTDMLLGMKAQILYSLATLFVALFWCQVMIKCFSQEKKEQKVADSLMIV